MKTKRLSCAIVALMLTTLSSFAAYADSPIITSAQIEQTKFEQDRKLILGMAGTFKVRFDMHETTAWQKDYTPIQAKVLGGNEVVLVVEDTGKLIRLQHLLVTEQNGKTYVVKHWRQDWAYEPEAILTYAGQGKWGVETVAESMRKGRWSQTVWQTDDSPRYAGWGEWSDEGGVPRWRSNWTMRPLARRDAVRHPVYDRYRSINRHSPTPTGWIHWQDNLKIGMKDGKLIPIVQETVLNSYDRFDGYDVKAATDYWTKTSGYWIEVRKTWDAIIAKNEGVHVTEVAESGSLGAERLMALADQILAGKIKQADAVVNAHKIIAEVTAH